jgi:hypothetical protein
MAACQVSISSDTKVTHSPPTEIEATGSSVSTVPSLRNCSTAGRLPDPDDDPTIGTTPPADHTHDGTECGGRISAVTDSRTETSSRDIIVA